jgi:hypothetical protein
MSKVDEKICYLDTISYSILHEVKKKIQDAYQKESQSEGLYEQPQSVDLLLRLMEKMNSSCVRMIYFFDSIKKKEQ